MTKEAGMCMKTNKKMTICPREKATFLHNGTAFRTPKHVFCLNRRLFFTVGALGNEPHASKCGNLGPRPSGVCSEWYFGAPPLTLPDVRISPGCYNQVQLGTGTRMRTE